MKKVFLTNPPLNMAETPLQYHRPLVPLGLGHLGGALEDHFTDGRWSEYFFNRVSKQIDQSYYPSGLVAAQDNMLLSFYGRYNFDHLLSRMKVFAEGCPEEDFYIGMSILSDGMRAAREMLKSFRFHFPLAKIMVGGPHATFFPHDFYLNVEEKTGPLVDYVVRNEGEVAIIGIVEDDLTTAADLQSNGERYGINLLGSDYSDEEYRIIDGGQFKGDSNHVNLHVLDELPIPAYFLFEEDGQLPYEPDRRYGLSAPAANINSSRGCPHKCTFCTIPKLAPGYRSLSPQRMAEMVSFLIKEYQIQSLFFREDNFMYSGGTVTGDRWEDIESFCNIILEQEISISWAIEARADNIMQKTKTGETRLDLLKRSGLTGVYMGVESGSELMLKLYGKGANLEAMSTAISACHERDVAVVATTIFSDPDLQLKRNYPIIEEHPSHYEMELRKQREEILNATRKFMDQLDVPEELREEYCLVGIPISTVYNLLKDNMDKYPRLVEHYDPITRYIYPKGFGWWSHKIYESAKRVRPYYGFDFIPNN